MDASTQQRPSGTDPRPGVPADAPEAVRNGGKDATPEQEHDAIHWLLGAQAPPRYDITIDFDTPEGMKKLVLTVRALDGKTFEKIEKANTNTDAGPFGEMDDLRVNAEVTAAALIEFRDPETGATVTKEDEKFRAGLADPADAIAQRFHWQSGLLSGVAGEVRRISGWAPDRVQKAVRVVGSAGQSTGSIGGASQALAEAAGNS